jgi:hypothetical protein
VAAVREDTWPTAPIEQWCCMVSNRVTLEAKTGEGVARPVPRDVT